MKTDDSGDLVLLEPDKLLAKFQKLYEPLHVMEHPNGHNENLSMKTYHNGQLKDKVFHANLTCIYKVSPNDNLYRNQTLDDELPWGVMVDGSDSILLATNLDGRIIDLNNEAIEKLSPEKLSDDVTFAQNHIGRHYTRYLEYGADRTAVTKKFDEKAIKGVVPDDFENPITLVSNDFNFEDGSTGYDMLVRLHMYPHFDKNGVVAGVIFEGQQVTEQIFQARMANSILKGYGDFADSSYDVSETTLQYTRTDGRRIEDTDSEDEDGPNYEELYNEDDLFMRKMHGPMVGLDKSQNIEAITTALSGLCTLEKTLKRYVKWMRISGKIKLSPSTLQV